MGQPKKENMSLLMGWSEYKLGYRVWSPDLVQAFTAMIFFCLTLSDYCSLFVLFILLYSIA